MKKILLFTLALVFSAAGAWGQTTHIVIPGEGTPIQDAIDGAAAGDIIQVAAGHYNENLIIDKALSLIGAGRDVTTIEAVQGRNFNGGGMQSPVIQIAGSASLLDFKALEINSPTNIAGLKSVSFASFGILNDEPGWTITGDIILTDPALGCTPISTDLTGKIALIDRGTCNFSIKAYEAQVAGAIGVIIANTDDNLITMGAGTYAEDVDIPVLMIKKSDADAIKAELLTEVVNGSFTDPVQGDGSITISGFTLQGNIPPTSHNFSNTGSTADTNGLSTHGIQVTDSPWPPPLRQNIFVTDNSFKYCGIGVLLYNTVGFEVSNNLSIRETHERQQGGNIVDRAWGGDIVALTGCSNGVIENNEGYAPVGTIKVTSSSSNVAIRNNLIEAPETPLAGDDGYTLNGISVTVGSNTNITIEDNIVKGLQGTYPMSGYTTGWQGAAVSINGGTGFISNNVFENNTIGVETVYPTDYAGETVVLRNNDFLNNSFGAFNYRTATNNQTAQITIDAQQNYWNTPDGPEVVNVQIASSNANFWTAFFALINDESFPENAVSDMVDFAPYLQTNMPVNVYRDGDFISGHETIQAAINVAVDGDVIEVAAGEFEELNGLYIDKSLTINGAGEDQTFVKISRPSSGYGIRTSSDDELELTFTNMTFEAVENITNFFFHIAHNKSFTLEDVTVIGMGKDYYSPGDETWDNTVGGVDIINVENGTLINVTVEEASRNAISLSAVKNIVMGNIAVENSGARGGSSAVAFYNRADYPDNNTTSISWDGGSITDAPIGVNMDGGAFNVVSDDEIKNVIFTNNVLQAVASSAEAEALLANNTFDRAVVIRAGEELIHKGKQTRGGDIKVPVIYSNIQDAIDNEFIAADDVVDVAAGTYVEQLIIDKNITIIGTGLPTIEAPTVGDRTQRPISGGVVDRTYDWVVLIEDADVTFSGFKIDGKDSGVSNRFVGILIGNSEGTVSNNEVFNIRGGDGGTSGIIAVGESTDILIDENTVYDFRKAGIVVNREAEGTITNNTVTGDGKITTIAQNGIQMGFGATGTIKSNQVSGIWYDTSGWHAAGILIIADDEVTNKIDVVIEDNDVENCQYGISVNPHFVEIEKVIIEENRIIDCNRGISVDWRETPGGIRKIINNTVTGCVYGTLFFSGQGWNLENNNYVDNTYGIWVADDSENNTLTQNTFTGTGWGVVVYGSTYGNPENTAINYNSIATGGGVFSHKHSSKSDNILSDIPMATDRPPSSFKMSKNDSPLNATQNYWGGCPYFIGEVEVYPYYTEASGEAGNLVFNGIVNNITATATPDQACVGEQVTLLASGGSNYQWDQGLGSGSLKVVSHTEADTYTYNVTGSDSRNCPIAYATVTVTVTEAPTVLINDVENGSATIVAGDPFTLTASGAETYEWVNMSETDAEITVSPQASTTYSVIGTTEDGCIGKTNFTVYVASVNAGPNQWSCQGADVTLTAVATGLDNPTFSWTWGENGSASGSEITVNPNSTTVYTVTATEGGITVTDNVTVFVYPKPVANAGSNITIPIGGSGVLNGSASGGTAPYSYFWTGPNGFESTEKNPIVEDEGTYTLVVTDAFLCESDEATVEVTVVDSGVTVSGDIEYAFGVVNKEMHNVTVKLYADNGGEPNFEGDPDYTGITAATGPGVFEIVGVAPGTYFVKFDLDTDWGGVTAADIVAINNHIRGRVPLTGIKRIAADVYVEGSGFEYEDAEVTIQDRNLVNQRRLGQVSEFPETGDWVFTLSANIEDNPPENDSFVFANDQFSNLSIVVGEEDETVDFRALCYGDVNASYTGPKELDFDFKDYGLPVFDVTEENWFELLNYPNPFTGETTIRYYQPIAGNVSIMVFNMMGEMIKKIEEPAAEEGTYDIPVNMHGHNPGLYIYILKLRTNDDIMIQHGKMILSR